MFPSKEFEDRFREILDDLDALKDQNGASDEMEELNADFEDALFVIESIEEDDDWREAFEDALDELEDLRESYRAQAAPGLAEIVVRLDKAIRLARANL